ncbi:MAG TPA: hypothetical protein PKU91_02505 [Phycisphaerales bacterium]|nr:hypothetical protein [Phycisphaerales bacterium]
MSSLRPCVLSRSLRRSATISAASGIPSASPSETSFIWSRMYARFSGSLVAVSRTRWRAAPNSPRCTRRTPGSSRWYAHPPPAIESDAATTHEAQSPNRRIPSIRSGGRAIADLACADPFAPRAMLETNAFMNTDPRTRPSPAL